MAGAAGEDDREICDLAVSGPRRHLFQLSHYLEDAMTTKVDLKGYEGRCLAILSEHIGAHKAIGMAELYEAVFGETWSHRINDTRLLRTLVTQMRRDGVAICSAASKSGGGYYLAAAGSELKNYLARNKMRALKILARNAAIEKITLQDYLGQMRLNMEGREDADHQT